MTCGLCGWFSVIGAVNFGVLAAMLYRRNEPVIEHKFGVEKEGNLDEYQKKIDGLTTDMVIMAMIMVVASVFCFGSSIVFAKNEAERLEKEKEEAVRNYAAVFKNELLAPSYIERGGKRYYAQE